MDGSTARTWRSMNAVRKIHSAPMWARTINVTLHFNCPTCRNICSVPKICSGLLDASTKGFSSLLGSIYGLYPGGAFRYGLD